MGDSRAPGDSDTLHGWKEIAAHLGKSVRSAQRWEARLGMPVRRIGTPDGGQIVHASRSEIDAWRLRQAEMPADGDDGDADADGDPADSAELGGDASHSTWADSAPVRLDPAPPRSEPPAGGDAAVPPTSAPSQRARRLAVPGAMLALGVAIGASLTFALMPIVVTPVDFEVEGREIRALDRSGRLAWTHALDRTGTRPAHMSQSQAEQGDIDGDGSFEVAVAVSYTTPNWLPDTVSDEVLLFSRTGRLRWRVQPAASLQFAMEGRTIRGPWLLHDVAFATVSAPGPTSLTGSTASAAPPAAGRGRLWLAYSDPNARLGFVIEVGDDGRQMLRYVQDGPVKSLVHWRTSSGNFLAAGGIDADTHRASTAVIDLDGRPARWPVTGVFSCSGCPTAGPRALALMPRSEVGHVLLRASPIVFRVVAENGTLRMDDDDGARSGALAWLAPDMRVVRYVHSSRYWEAHRQLELQGRITHSSEACPSRRTPASMRVWTTEGWTEQSVPPTPPS